MEEKFVTIDANKIRYLEEGESSKNVVLVHGLGASAERWEYVIPHLSKKYHVVAPDLIGFGYSDKPSVDYTAELFTKFLFDFLNSIDLRKASLVGSSLGGQIVAECASMDDKNIEKIVMVSPSGVMKHSSPTLDAYMMAALYPSQDAARTAFQMMAAPNKQIDNRIVENFVQRMALPNAKMAFMSTVLALRNSTDIGKKLEKISVPTLIVWGKHDSLIPIKYSKEFISSIKNCQFVTMEECGHTPYVEEPEKFSKIVLDFLGH